MSADGLQTITKYWPQVISVSADGLTMLTNYWSQVKFVSADGLEKSIKN